ncbi:MAG: RNA polymerase sigma factor, partial [Steroidobacteraceae bacterium]
MLTWRKREVAQLDDRELVSRFLSDREERPFRELYRRHTPLIYRVSVRMLYGEPRPNLSAEDATQECWLRAVRGLEGFEWRSAFPTWLVGIALRVCAEGRRAPAAVHGLDDYIESVSPPALDAAALERIDIERLLATLPVGYRTVVILHDIEGFTHDEISAALGI